MGSGLPTWSPPQKTLYQQFRQEPAIFLARRLHQLKPIVSPRQRLDTSVKDPITIVCISDTHTSQPEIPQGDVLLHAGDLTNHGSFDELQAQLDWLASLPHRHKVITAGNHDRLLDPEYVAKFPDRICETEGKSCADLQWHDLIYLNNSSATLQFTSQRKLNIFGSPWTPQCGTFAFQYPPIRDIWTEFIPDRTDVLLVHGPPKGYRDLDGKGCPYLMREVARTRPRMVVFGHIHAAYGQEDVKFCGVERCYHRVMAGDGGVSTILVMIGWLLISWIMTLVPSWPCLGGGNRQQDTIMINAALAGGPDNETSPAAVVVAI